MQSQIPIAVAVILGIAAGSGCGQKQTAEPDKPPQMVYVDVQTKSVVVAPRTKDTPAVNPKTGRRTLMPGLYCSHCRRWHPAPPLQVVQRNPAARKCPKCKRSLTSEGPFPDE